MVIYEVEKEDCKLQIVVNVYCSCGEAKYTVRDILYTPKQKRKAVSIAAIVRDRYEYRSREYDKRGEYVKSEYMKYCSEEDIQNAINYAYSMMKPSFENVFYAAN